MLQETLTGFKWMGNKTAELQRQGKSVLFAYEEAIGFMCGTAVLDKDGISAGIRVAEMAAYLSKKDMSLMDKLKELFSVWVQGNWNDNLYLEPMCICFHVEFSLVSHSLSKKTSMELILCCSSVDKIFLSLSYGHHISCNSYYICNKQPVIQRLFGRLRTFSGSPDTVCIHQDDFSGRIFLCDDHKWYIFVTWYVTCVVAHCY